MKAFKILRLALLTAVSISQASYGQVGTRGGGKAKEADLRHFVGMMEPYFQSDEGKRTFPEIVAYDKTHLPEESFHHLMKKVHPVVIDGPVQDNFQDDRDCVADFTDKNKLFFTCNGNALPEMKLENHPSFYRIVLHELFVIAGIEKPISKAIPSDYSVSYRITTNVHLETQQAWVPGKAQTQELNCYKDPSGDMGSTLLMLAKTGATECFRKIADTKWGVPPTYEARDEKGRTPLNAAASIRRDGGLGIVNILLTKKVNLEAKDVYGQTPLISAAYDSPAVATALIEAGADVNAHDDLNDPIFDTPSTPLTSVTNYQLAQLMIAKGADVDKSNAILTQTRWAVLNEEINWHVYGYEAGKMKNDSYLEETFKFIKLYAENGGSVKKAIELISVLAEDPNTPIENYKTYQFLMMLK